MNKSQRIRTEVGAFTNKHLKIKLEQNTSTLEILSLKIDQRDDFPFYNCNYGVLVGRAVANGGVGIPNAKISVFVPLDEADQSRDEIIALYPYTSPRDKNKDGKRYNLLPRVARVDSDGIIKPKQPFGSFPIKEEVVTNETVFEVYEKYYKYTTVTNDSGDYMLYGVPVGVQTIHMSVDITDIGKYSMTPGTMVTNLGYSPNLFNNNLSRIKEKEDLDDLPHIETQEISVEIIPFCGDEENFDIGITRQDFRLRAELINSFVVFGTSFTDGVNSAWGEQFSAGDDTKELYRAKNDANVTIGMFSKRTGIIKEKVFSVLQSVSDSDIDSLNFNPDTQMYKLDEGEYTSYKRSGDFVLLIPCNRRKVITDELGQEVIVDSSSPNGIFTRFVGFMTFEYDNAELPMPFTMSLGNETELKPIRTRLRIPQNASRGQTFNISETDTRTLNWKKQTFEFTGGEYYSVAKFFALLTYDTNNDSDNDFDGVNNGFASPDKLNRIQDDSFRNMGIIYTSTYSTGGNEYDNGLYEFPSNYSFGGGVDAFGANWVNFCLYFNQIAEVQKGYSQISSFKTQPYLTSQYKTRNYTRSNTQTIAGGVIDTGLFARSDLHYTDFITVPKTDILAMLDVTTKGFVDSALPISPTGSYKNGQSEIPYIEPDAVYKPNTDTDYYFYKGFNSANCIEYLSELGLL